MNDLVSVVIPTQKGADGILKTINSVRNQTYQSLEIIVVDDNGLGSEEQKKTAKVLENLILGGEVRYLPLKEHKNGSYARNAGFHISLGAVITFLDDDDMLLPTKIEDELKYMTQTHSDMVACGGYFINRNRVGYIERPKEGKNLLYDYLTGKYLFNTSTLLIKRNVVEELNGFDDRFYRHQDWEFVTRIMCSYKVSLLEKPLVIKLGIGRNRVIDPNKAARLREFFLQEIKEKIKGSLGDRLTQKVINHHYRDLAIGYFFQGQWGNGLNILKKTGSSFMNLLKCIPQVGYLAIRKQCRGRKTVSSEDLCNLV